MTTINLDTLAIAIDTLETATLALSTAENCGLASEVGDVRDWLTSLQSEYSDEFECDSCGKDYPITLVAAKGPLSLFCPNCTGD
jgi:hypothetical protein